MTDNVRGRIKIQKDVPFLLAGTKNNPTPLEDLLTAAYSLGATQVSKCKKDKSGKRLLALTNEKHELVGFIKCTCNQVMSHVLPYLKQNLKD